MTDEEMAEEYIASKTKEWTDGAYDFTLEEVRTMLIEFAKELVEENSRLKAGRPQWHTDPNDLPKMIEDERKISQDVWLHINYWVVRCRQGNLPVIAWCEIPTFDKE